MKKEKFTIIGSANAGICLILPDGMRLWVDFYPYGKTRLFSCLKEDAWQAALADPRLTPPDLAVFTHCHPDHFSLSRTEELQKRFPQVRILYPEGALEDGTPIPRLPGTEPVRGEELTVEAGGAKLRFLRTLHSGKSYLNTPHYSLFLSWQGRTVFLSGDAMISNEFLTETLEYVRTDLAVLTFPWASTSIGRERVRWAIAPSHVLLMHIPAEEDDRMGFRAAAENGAGLLEVPDVRLLMNPFQEEVFLL